MCYYRKRSRFQPKIFIIYPKILPLAALILLARTSAGLLLSLYACPCGFFITAPLGAIVKFIYLVWYLRLSREKLKT